MSVKILSKADFDEIVVETQDADKSGWSKIDFAQLKPATLTLKGTWNAAFDPASLKALLAPFPFEAPMRPDVQLDELLTQIEGFTTGDQLARFFFDQGVRGFQTQPGDCPFAKWIKVVTGKDFHVGSRWITRPEDPTGPAAVLNSGSREFVTKFDLGCYPQLVQGHQRNVVTQCPCDLCASLKVVTFEAA
jgi:hypothetical protein